MQKSVTWLWHIASHYCHHSHHRPSNSRQLKQISPPRRLSGTEFPILEYICTSGMPNPAAAVLSGLRAEKATQESGIWRHLFLSRCDQSGDLLLCFNSEVKGACGMRMGTSVCVCVCIEGLRRALPRGGTPWPLADPSPPGVWLWTSAKAEWMCSRRLR